MGGTSSKSKNTVNMRMTDITNNVTENVSNNSQTTIAKIEGIQNMKIGSAKIYGCKNSSIKQGMELSQDVKATLSDEQIIEAETAIKNKLKDEMKADSEAESGALSMPFGKSNSEVETEKNIDSYIETNNLMKNVKETMQKTVASINAKQEMNIVDFYADPCGIGMFKDMMSGIEGANPLEMAQAIKTMTAGCDATCSIEQNMLLKQTVAAGVAQVANNITKHKKESGLDSATEAKSKAKDKGALEEYGDAWAAGLEGAGTGVGTAMTGTGEGIGTAVKGAGEGVSTAVKGAGEGVSTAAKGTGDGIGGAAKGVTEGIGSMFSPGMIMVVGLVVVAGVILGPKLLEAQKNAVKP